MIHEEVADALVEAVLRVEEPFTIVAGVSAFGFSAFSRSDKLEDGISEPRLPVFVLLSKVVFLAAVPRFVRKAKSVVDSQGGGGVGGAEAGGVAVAFADAGMGVEDDSSQRIITARIFGRDERLAFAGRKEDFLSDGRLDRREHRSLVLF